MTALDRDWFQPLLAALRTRRLSSLRLLSNGDADALEFLIRPQDMFRFWRKNKYLE